jgi:class 3 adenylate cyclase/tetratricopeptide (TPR) repeat protein
MAACPNCGRENADDARFCSACGTDLARAAEPAREQRKVVTVLFCDLVGSTALGESTDPEALRARMRRYFEDLRVILERHGGTVEKFVGDAVMAVFGIPVSHEDDALRAVRAASEMRAAIAEHGLEARIGINTGEVVVGGEAETLVTGDAVNVAARLEQAAGAGEVFIGAETHSLVRDAVRVEVVEPLVLKGKAEPVSAFSVLEVLAESEGLARNPEALLVGRKRERNRLWRDFEDVLDDQSCRLVTLLGPAGIGKSRLVVDFLERVDDSADILRGRCLSYGEGITYWPLVEILIAIGVEPDSVIGTSPPETQLAFRRLLERRAAERPQVVLVDDLQWAEPVFIDLVEHVADLSRDAPIFLLCVARTELLDVRPDWGGGKMNATSILLEPLGDDECEALIGNLLGDGQLEGDLRDRIMAASAGNPLYVEEMLAMVREHGGEREIVVPPTIHALLQARIDSLDGDVRVVMERGSVEGEVFHRGAVAELSPAPVRGDVGSHLTTLVRKELIRSTAPTFPEDEGYRFRHLLIRDAAYESLPKATRAELHEQFADWLSTHDLVEGDEIVGYHLEQAHRYRMELDPGDGHLDELSRRASSHLADAGRGALERGDYRAALSLLRRASDLLDAFEEERHVLAPDLVMPLWESGELERARAVASAAVDAKDPVVAALATIAAAVIDLVSDGGPTREERLERVELAHDVLRGASHERGLGLYWWYRAGEEWLQLHAAATAEACERGLEHFERSPSFAQRQDLLGWIKGAYVLGPTPVADAIERMETLLTKTGGRLLDTVGASASLGRLLAMRGDFERARALYAEATETYEAIGMTVSLASFAMYGAWIEQRAGETEAWEGELRLGLKRLEPFAEERAYRATIEGLLAHCLYQQGRLEESQDFSRRARESSPPADLVNFLYADAVDAALAARRGAVEEALVLMRRAFAFVETTDFVADRAEVRVLYAEIHQLAGRVEEATELATQALELLDEKGDLTFADRVRERLATIGVALA